MPEWPSRTAVVAEARKYIGMGENPPGSNRNDVTESYGMRDSWCAMFTWYVLYKLGVDLRKEYTEAWAYTPAGMSAAKAKGTWVYGLDGMRPGDLVYYKLPGGDAGVVNHTGFCVEAGFRNVTSIEGNTLNVCALRVRDASVVVGYIRLPLAEAGGRTAPPFPGRDAFQLNRANPAVTALDKQLIRLGYTHHNDGDGYQAGPTFTSYTRDNVAQFQRGQGWSGSDADGYPGPETWRRLHTLV